MEKKNMIVEKKANLGPNLQKTTNLVDFCQKNLAKTKKKANIGPNLQNTEKSICNLQPDELAVIQQHSQWGYIQKFIQQGHLKLWDNTSFLKNDDILNIRFKHWGEKTNNHTFLFHLKKPEELVRPIDFIVSSITENDIIIRSNATWGITKTTKQYLFPMISENHFLNEVIPEERARHPIFDVDAKKDKTLLTVNILKIQEKFGKDVLMAISGSCGMKEGSLFYSHHITLPDYYFKNHQE